MGGRAKGTSGTEGKVEWKCVWTQMCARVSQTGPRTTRIDILFGRKHNKVHRCTVQEEEGIILKVNKQRRRVVKVPALLLSQQRGESGLQRMGGNWGGFLNPVRPLVFQLWCSWWTCFLRESACLFDTSRYLFVWPVGESVCLQTWLVCRWRQPGLEVMHRNSWSHIMAHSAHTTLVPICGTVTS